jgi:hypothetical protein
MALTISNLNDYGAPETFQRLAYLIARASTHDEWRAVHALASELLEREIEQPDLDHNPDLKMLNLICSVTHEVRRLQNGLDRLVSGKE